MQRIILHCDLNNFFASASLAFNPTLKGLPVAICGDAKKRHGIVLAKNNIAKNFGVLTAETIWEAQRKCTDLVILKPDYTLYENVSKKAHQIYLRYTDKVEPFGIDECWVEITNSGVDFKKGEEIANKIRKEIKNELGITVSIGVSFTKTLAKLGSDLKKPDAITVISPRFLRKSVWKMSCRELLMVGKSLDSTLKLMGIFTIGDLANSDEASLKTRIGKVGVMLRSMARGEDCDAVRSYYKQVKPKSIGHSATTERDLKEESEVFAAFLEFSEAISQKLKKENLLARTIAISILTNKFENKEYRTALLNPTDISLTIAKSAMELFNKNNCLSVPLRAVGVRVINLIDNVTIKQLSLFEESENNIDNILENNILKIRNKYGKNSLKRAICINNTVKPSSPGFYK
ncbi:MAG: DNA polymerase IV [Ruminococcaceae bacterium]|nr:DNA polymerase IV [Oscillospiraceae bacterium]